MKADLPGTFNAGATLGPINETNMVRIWNKHKINTPLKRKVFVGMSGGVDSSVAAYLLKKQNYNVIGVYLLCFSGEEEVCRAKQDMEDARAVALQLNIPFYVWNLEKEYKERVIDYMVEGYRNGITPNPDVMCNREIKFGIFLRRALALGADYVATGHYARLRRETLNPKLEILKLFEARDKNKDQSYFLWTLTQDQLKHCLFPIGDYTKPEVRAIAREAGIKTADKKDSQGVCFVGKIKLSEFLSSPIQGRRGEIVTVGGEKVGEHNGAEFYTIGQRHLGIPNMKYGIQNRGKDTKPYYVVSKDIAANQVMVAEGSSNPALYKKEVELSDVSFIGQQHSNILQNVGMLSVMVRVRYRQPLSKAELRIKNSAWSLVFDEPIKFIAPGQSAVFYSGDGEMLGGGVIV